MNPHPSSLEQTQTASDSFPPSSGNDSEIVRLCCPACQKELNLLRKHFGLEGNCVHCQTPVRAVEGLNGVVSVENLSPVHSADSEDFPVCGTFDNSIPDDSAFGVSNVSAHQSPPSFLSKPEIQPEELTVKPSQLEEEKPLVRPPAFPEEDVTFAGKPERSCGIQSIPWTADSKENEEPLPDPSVGVPSSPFGNEPEKSPLFDEGTTLPPVEFKTSDEARTPWDEQPPTKPVNTGFAEALFSGKPEGSGDEGALQSGDESPQQSKKGLIGHPMQQASVATLKSSGSSKGLSPLVKKLRNLVVVAVLASLAYMGYSMAPPEKVESAKAKIKEWLKPGVVLLEDLPFKIPGLSDDKAPSHEKPVVVRKPKAPVAVESVPEGKPE